MEEEEWERLKEDEAWIWDDYMDFLTENDDNQYIDMWDERVTIGYRGKHGATTNGLGRRGLVGIRYRYIPALWSWLEQGKGQG